MFQTPVTTLYIYIYIYGVGIYEESRGAFYASRAKVGLGRGLIVGHQLAQVFCVCVCLSKH